MLKDDLFMSGSNTNTNGLPTIYEKQTKIDMDFLPKNDKLSEEVVPYLDLFTSNEILPYLIVSFQEYILVVRIYKYCKIKSILCMRKISISKIILSFSRRIK